MLYMILEEFLDGDTAPVHRSRRKAGRQTPDGLHSVRAVTGGSAHRARALALSLAAAGAWLAGCGEAPREPRELVVTATAYNSLPGQTAGDPAVAAWGDRLEPGMRAIAVSRDLLERGLTRGVEVEIEGLPGTYVVMDKLHRRWRKRIDIYMGTDREAARDWGKRTVRIRWRPEPEPSGPRAPER